MYTLLRGFWSYLSQRDEYSVLILGLDGAGKTTYLEQAKINFVPNYRSLPLQKITTTVGLNSGLFIYIVQFPVGQFVIGGVRLKFWDLGGQEELQSLWDKYYSESHGVIYVIDSTDPDRFDETRDAFDKMIRNPTLESVPLLILANKQDLPGAFPVGEVNKVLYDSMPFVGQRECTVRGVSALRGDGVPGGIRWMVEKIKQNASRRPSIKVT
ncbi:Ras gtpase [Paragonimus heterotremus]|uniref:ADP-ribosylation factor-related protein 1 n=1 Tax=Paragonimus heterotremus TaxID=100268 RepID=A0A8J4SF14_9TREM|nr:Ras gtpase [Paragonimus heterotremus]